jgi:hypothetical protein
MIPQPASLETLYFKILVPNTLIGSIIGKGGSCVNGMMVVTQSKIRVSQNHEFFPETDDRVIVISGPSENVHLGIYEVVTKYCEVMSACLSLLSPKPHELFFILPIHLSIPLSHPSLVLPRPGLSCLDPSLPHSSSRHTTHRPALSCPALPCPPSQDL